MTSSQEEAFSDSEAHCTTGVQGKEEEEYVEEGVEAPYVDNERTGILHAAQVGSNRNDTRRVIIAQGQV